MSITFGYSYDYLTEHSVIGHSQSLMIKHNISLNQASTALLVGKCSTFLIKLQNLARWSLEYLKKNTKYSPASEW